MFFIIQRLKKLYDISKKEDTETVEEKYNDKVTLLTKRIKQNRMKNADIYRLHYIYFSYFGHDYGHDLMECHNTVMQGFKLPNEMDMKDAFLIISYLTDIVERVFSIQEASSMSVIMTDKFLSYFGFQRIETNTYKIYEAEPATILNVARKAWHIHAKSILRDDIIDLYTVNDGTGLFGRTIFGKEYVDWYIKNVTEAEVKYILSKLNLEFSEEDLISKIKESFATDEAYKE